MGLLSSSLAITRYRVEGEIPSPLMDSVRDGLQKFSIQDIDNDAPDKAVGWTAWDAPFSPVFYFQLHGRFARAILNFFKVENVLSTYMLLRSLS